MTLGAGEQIAVTHFNTYNHETILRCGFRFRVAEAWAFLSRDHRLGVFIGEVGEEIGDVTVERGVF